MVIILLFHSIWNLSRLKSCPKATLLPWTAKLVPYYFLDNANNQMLLLVTIFDAGVTNLILLTPATITIATTYKHPLWFPIFWDYMSLFQALPECLALFLRNDSLFQAQKHQKLPWDKALQTWSFNHQSQTGFWNCWKFSVIHQAPSICIPNSQNNVCHKCQMCGQILTSKFEVFQMVGNGLFTRLIRTYFNSSRKENWPLPSKQASAECLRFPKIKKMLRVQKLRRTC